MIFIFWFQFRKLLKHVFNIKHNHLAEVGLEYMGYNLFKKKLELHSVLKYVLIIDAHYKRS